jgi:L-histidine N-alpha-methyltransferase
LRRAYPGLAMVPLCVDFTAPLPKPMSPAVRTAIFFPGSTIGNFTRDAAIQLLTRLRDFAGRHGALIIGADLVKDVSRLERAYNDGAGVTAEFNLNMLAHLNREYGSDFNLAAFAHDAPWIAVEQRIEMHLVSRWAQQVRIGGETIHFSAGERLRTETCHKYTLAGFAELAQQSGWDIQGVWTDPEAQFSIQYAEVNRRR